MPRAPMRNVFTVVWLATGYLSVVVVCGADCNNPNGCEAEAPFSDTGMLLQRGDTHPMFEPTQGEVPQPETDDDAAPQALDPRVLAEYTVSKKHMEQGAQLLKAKHGVLATEFMKMVTDVMAYWARVIHKVGQSTGPNATQSSFELPSEDRLKDIMKPWRTELLKFGNCSEQPMDMEECMGLMRCLIEPEVNTDGIPAAVFATLMEAEEEISNVILRDFELAFNHFKAKPLHPCEGEGNDQASWMELSARTSASQRSSVATVALINRAAEQTVKALESNLSLALTEVSDWVSIWEAPCAALECDPTSWQDVMQTMHGHAAKLGEARAPALAIRQHVRSMRAAHRAVTSAAGRSSDVVLAVVAREGHNEAKNARYDRAMKDVGGMLDGALMQLRGSQVALTTWGYCFSVMLGAVSAYVKKIPSIPTATWGAIVGLGVKGGITSNDLWSLLQGVWPNVGGTISLAFGILLGAVPGSPALVAMRAGVSVTAGVSLKLKNGTVNAPVAVSVSGSGALVTRSTACPFGPRLEPFGCVTAATVGVGLICCKFDLLTGESNCR